MVDNFHKQEIVSDASVGIDVYTEEDKTIHDTAYVLRRVYEEVRKGWYLRSSIDIHSSNELEENLPLWYQRALASRQFKVLFSIILWALVMYCVFVVGSILFTGIIAPYTQGVSEFVYTHSIFFWLVPTALISIAVFILLVCLVPDKYEYLVGWEKRGYEHDWCKNFRKLRDSIDGGRVSSTIKETKRNYRQRAVVKVEINTSHTDEKIVLYLQHDDV